MSAQRFRRVDIRETSHEREPETDVRWSESEKRGPKRGEVVCWRRDINMLPPGSARLSTLDCPPRVSPAKVAHITPSSHRSFSTSTLSHWYRVVTRARLSLWILNHLTALPQVLQHPVYSRERGSPLRRTRTAYNSVDVVPGCLQPSATYFVPHVSTGGPGSCAQLFYVLNISAATEYRKTLAHA